MSEEHDDLIHLDGLIKLVERAALANAATGGREYERFGICTPDLVGLAKQYGSNTIRQVSLAGGGVHHAMAIQFLDGFDIGYQARLELESRTLAKADIFDKEDPTWSAENSDDGRGGSRDL